MSASGAVIMGVFAAVWWVVGIRASGPASVLMYGIPIVITGAIIAAASSGQARTARPSDDERARQGRLVGIASGIEGVAIFVAVNVLANIKRLEFVAPVVAIKMSRCGNPSRKSHESPMLCFRPSRLSAGWARAWRSG